MKFNFISLAFIFTIVLSQEVNPPEAVTKVATCAANWLKIESGVKGISMGGSQVASGSGISGICHIQLAKNKGLKIIATDIADYRIEQAIKFGADHSFNAKEMSDTCIKEINSDRLVDKVIVCSGTTSAVEDSFKYIDRKGEILFFAVPPENMSLSSVNLWRNELSLFFSYGAASHDITETIELYKEKKINFKEMITHKFALSEIKEGFKIVESAKDSMKVVVNP